MLPISSLDAQGRNAQFILLFSLFFISAHNISMRLIESTHKIYILYLCTLFNFLGDGSLQSTLALTRHALVPRTFFQFLGTPVSWLEQDLIPLLGQPPSSYLYVSTSVITLMTHLSKTGPSAVVVSLCLRNMFFFPLLYFHDLFLFTSLTKLFCFTIFFPST